MGSISSTWEQSKAFQTSLSCKRVHWCHSWPAHCIPHLPTSDRWHLCHFVTWTVNPLKKCSSTNMSSQVLSEWHYTNECHGSAQSYPLQWLVKNVNQHVLGYTKATANTQKLTQQIPNAKICIILHCFMRLHTAWSHGSEYTHPSWLTPRWTTCVASKLCQWIRKYEQCVIYIFLLFACTVNYMCNYNYRQNHLVLVLTLEVLWYYGSKINMATPLADCTLCPTKIKQPAILYTPLQLQSQFKSVTFPIFVNSWSLSSFHYNQSCCVHIN